jgi:hypothetical protein
MLWRITPENIFTAKILRPIYRSQRNWSGYGVNRLLFELAHGSARWRGARRAYGNRVFSRFDELRTTAARMRALKTLASICSPSWMSMGRNIFQN